MNVEPQVSRPRLPVRNGLVVVGDLAVFLGVDRSNLRKKLLRAGYVLDLMPFPQAGNQNVMTMPEGDARRFIAEAYSGPLSGVGTISYLDEVEARVAPGDET